MRASWKVSAIVGALTYVSGCMRARAEFPATGTCAGACAHYGACKGSEAAEAICRAECPETLSDPQSLAEFERLSCTHAVEFIDGLPPTVPATVSTSAKSCDGARRRAHASR